MCAGLLTMPGESLSTSCRRGLRTLTDSLGRKKVVAMVFDDTFKGAIMAGEGTVFDIKKEIQAMTTFRRNPGKFMKHLKKTKKPLVLTINGKAEAVVQDAEAYQR